MISALKINQKYTFRVLIVVLSISIGYSLVTETYASNSTTSSATTQTTTSAAAAAVPTVTTTTLPAITAERINQENHKSHQQNNCSLQCTTSEFTVILQRIIISDDASGILRRFKEIEDTLGADGSKNNTAYSGKASPLTGVRASCVRELVALIKSLASNELELKSLFEFASNSGANSLASKIQLPHLSGKAASSTPDSTQMKWLQSGGSISTNSALYNRSHCANSPIRDQQPVASEQSADLNHPEVLSGSSEKSSVLPKLVANVDQWINTLERFTVTQEWASLIKVFQGTESILSMFIQATTKTSSVNKIVAASSEVNINQTISKKQVQQVGNSSDFLENLKVNLPTQVMTLTSSLNNLFPWHVWPWNNLDLYNTIDTFLNHGIFAFSKTTVGPDRRIEFLPDMLHALFKSFKYETFPKKCTEWSRIICDPLAFHDRLVLGPLVESDTENISANSTSSSAALTERELKVKELSLVSKNQLTQELTCIMFSSLSVQHFGASKEQVNSADESSILVGDPQSLSATKLNWARQVQKGIKLYTLAREALSDEQWLTIYNLLHELWSQQKITDRVVMVGRVIQLLTNCHVPKEMLESALWKDIYKYKNVLNQLVDIVVEELNRSSENGKLSVEQISFGSKSLDVILRKFIKLLPKLVESLSYTIVEQLPELVSKFFNDKIPLFKVPCKGYSFSDIIPSLVEHQASILEIEELVCQQLNTKPNITMMQINNLTNDFLAMAFNFSGNLGNALALPKLLANNAPVEFTSTPATLPEIDSNSAKSAQNTSTATEATNNGNITSIIDEMAANPRLAQIVAILQSSALDPPEVHAELPELDWVEAGTSVALLYDSIQKLLSYEQIFTIFPEIEEFQVQIDSSVGKSKQMFKKFSKQDPIRLVAYSLDTIMPIALRTFKPMESFHAECRSSFRDIFSEDSESKVTRQWHCLVSSANFASWALNNFMKTFNSMFRNILTHMTLSTISAEQQKQGLRDGRSEHDNNSCIFFDGSISMMLDNLPHFIDLALETVLMASTSSEQQQLTSLYDIMCSSNYMLDPFNERSVELKAKMKDKMCHLFHKRSMANCAQVLKFDLWTSTMRQLNTTWFESNALSISPSFREVTINVHEFLKLFGQFKPSTMSDSLLARVLNVNSFWVNLLNRIMGIIDKYQEKRFEYALQTLTPIIYDNLPISSVLESENFNRDSNSSISSSVKEVRETLITTILGAKAILNYLDKQSTLANENVTDRLTIAAHEDDNNEQDIRKRNTTATNEFELQIQTLFNWADQYSMISAETLLKTIANNITKLELIFSQNNTTTLNNNSTTKLNMTQVWDRFCSSPVDQYLDLERYELISNNNETVGVDSSINPPLNISDGRLTGNKTVSQMYVQMNEGKEIICKFAWQTFYQQLGADSSKILADYPERQLTRIMLTKWGQVLDVMFIESKHIKQLPKFFYMSYWQLFRDKLPQISPLKDQPSNLVWIWIGFERIVNAMDAGTNLTSDSLVKILDQLNCGLDAVKGGLSWDNIASIYSDKQDILAAHSTINNGFALASIGVNTFLAQRKFQKFLDEIVKPRVGLNAFCEMRDRNRLESIFSIPEGEGFISALESFQELICDTNFETLAQNINPISICYQTSLLNQQQPVLTPNSTTTTTTTTTTGIVATSGGSSSRVSLHPLADIMDRFFKLASLAILDAKLVAASEAKPPILDKNQWSSFWNWWSDKAEPQPKSSVALTVVRALQTIDSINSEHVVWKAFFRSIHEISEIASYLLKAIEKKQQEVDMLGAASRLSLVREAATQLDSVIRGSNGLSKQSQQQQLASTLSNILFPEVNNFISFRTFKQLRYIKSIADFFISTPGAQESVCQSIKNRQNQIAKRDANYHYAHHYQNASSRNAQIELIDYKLNSNEKLYSLMCHYHSSQWLTALNIVISTRTTSIPKKINYITKYISIFTRNYKDNENLMESFIHNQQLEDIESVANTTVSYLLATSNSLKSLSFSKISNISWHSLPNLFDSIDRHLCASKYEQGTFYIPKYEPKKPELEVVLCKLPHWNVTQVYSYLSENFDLQNMISLITTTTPATTLPTNRTLHEIASTFLQAAAGNNNTSSNDQVQQETSGQQEVGRRKTCVTSFKFLSRWLRIGQELVDDVMSKTSRDKIKKCLSSTRKGQSMYSQTLRFNRALNSLLSSINDLTSSDSWPAVKRTWSSISFLLLNQQTLHLM